jgi:hypothetical protein
MILHQNRRADFGMASRREDQTPADDWGSRPSTRKLTDRPNDALGTLVVVVVWVVLRKPVCQLARRTSGGVPNGDVGLARPDLCARACCFHQEFVDFAVERHRREAEHILAA